MMRTGKLIVAAIVLSGLGLAGYRFATQDAYDLAEVKRPPVRVNVMEIQPQRLAAWAFAEGTAEARNKAYLNFEQSGKVVHIGSQKDGSVLREGSRVFGPKDDVRLGQLLVSIDNRENSAQVEALEANLQSARERQREARAGLARANNDLEQAKRDHSRTRKIFEKGVVSRDEFDRSQTQLLNAETAVAAAESALKAVISEENSVAAELNRATVSLEKTSLFAPFDGVITGMNVDMDNYYYPPAGITTGREREATSGIVIVDDSSFEIQLEVPVSDAEKIKEGQTVYLANNDQALYRAAETNFENTTTVTGQVWSVSPSISLQSRSQLIKVRTNSDASSLRDGMFLKAWIATEEIPHTLVLPWSVLSFRDGSPYVYVINHEKEAERRWLTLGVQGLRDIQVISGLQAGDQVIVRGQHLVTDGSLVKVRGSGQ